jgi:hypothetical protein
LTALALEAFPSVIDIFSALGAFSLFALKSLVALLTFFAFASALN